MARARKAKPGEGASVYYVYALIDPENDEIFYIGKGKGDRCNRHVKEHYQSQRINEKKHDRIGRILGGGRSVKVSVLVDGLTEASALQLERQKIAAMKSALTNIGAGRFSEIERAYYGYLDIARRLRTTDQWREHFVRSRKRFPTDFEQEIECLVRNGIEKDMRHCYTLLRDMQVNVPVCP